MLLIYKKEGEVGAREGKGGVVGAKEGEGQGEDEGGVAKTKVKKKKAHIWFAEKLTQDLTIISVYKVLFCRKVF